MKTKWRVGMVVTHRLGRFVIEFVDGHDFGEPQLCVHRVGNPSDGFKDYAFLFKPEASDKAECAVPECLGGTTPRPTWGHVTYEDFRDHRLPCLECIRAGRPIANGTEEHAVQVSRRPEHHDPTYKLSR